jgi:hypothetical protein
MIFKTGFVIGFDRFLVSGEILSLIERIVNMLSIAPAAPKV